MTATNTKPAGAPKTAARRPKSIARMALTWSLIVFAALLLLSILFVWMTFSPLRKYPEPKIGKEHNLLLRRLATEMRINRKLDEATLRFSPKEVQLLLDLIRHTSQFVKSKKKLPAPENFMLTYRDDGSVHFAVPVNAMDDWCFGGRIYLSGELFFEKHGDKIELDLPRLRFGRFDIPVPGGIDLYVPSWRNRVKRSLSKEFMTAVKDIYPERDGTVVIVYRPQLIRAPLKKKLDQIHQRCSGELRLPIRELIKAL